MPGVPPQQEILCESFLPSRSQAQNRHPSYSREKATAFPGPSMPVSATRQAPNCPALTRSLQDTARDARSEKILPGSGTRTTQTPPPPSLFLGGRAGHDVSGAQNRTELRIPMAAVRSKRPLTSDRDLDGPLLWNGKLQQMATPS